MRIWILLAPLAWTPLVNPLLGGEEDSVCEQSAEDFLPSEPFSHELLSYRLPAARRWDLAVRPFSGLRWPGSEREKAQMVEEYGLRVGATWIISTQVRMGFEFPYKVGQLTPADGAALRNDITPERVTRVDGLLTLSVQF